MRLSHRVGWLPGRAIARVFASIAGTLVVQILLSSQGQVLGTTVSAQRGSNADAGYVGSRACAKCHPSIYDSFSRTDMGRSMAEITPALLERIPSSASIFDPKLNR